MGVASLYEEPIIDPNARSHRVAGVIVIGVWGIMLAAALGYTWWYGFRYVTFWDEWTMVPSFTGDWPVNAKSLWEQYTEHRIPLPKLLLLNLYRITKFDFRAGPVFSVLALGAVSLLLICAARRMRGFARLTDAFFPIALLHWGQCQNFLYGFQVQFTTSTLFAGIVLAIVAGWGTSSGILPGLLVGLSLLFLPLCGSNGLPYVVMMVPWVVFWGLSRRPRSTAIARVLTLATALAALALTAYYFVDYKPVRERPDPPDAWTLARSVAQFLATSFGPASATLGLKTEGHPYWTYFGAAAIASILVSVAILIWVSWRQPNERFRAAGLFLFLMAVVGLIVAIAWGRAAMSKNAGLDLHYAVLTTPIWCCIYFIWELPKNIVGRCCQTLLLAVFVALLYGNAKQAITSGNWLRERKSIFLTDVLNGTPISVLTERYTDNDGPWMVPPSHRDNFQYYLGRLKLAGIGPYAQLPDEIDIDLPVESAAVHLENIEWNGRRAEGKGRDSTLTFIFEPLQHVNAIRLKFRYVATTSPARFQISWGTGGVAGYVENGRSKYYELSTEDSHTLTVPINAALDQLRIHPDSRPFVFELDGIVLWVPGKQLLLKGAFDGPTDDYIAGWVYQEGSPHEPLSLDIYDGSTFLKTVRADEYRDDLLSAGVPTAYCAYSIATPSNLKDGKPHVIRVLVSATKQPVPGSPKTYNSKQSQ